ncbi:hypothetical protein LXL04_015139 [Taraxacum kok-saghyz]
MLGKRKDSDRISELPQDIIEKILTLMPIRDSLRTSILSRKWSTWLQLSSVLCVISSSPNLEKMKLQMCWDHDECLEETFEKSHDLQDYMSLKWDHLEEVEITRSPMLKRATIELYESASVKDVSKFGTLAIFTIIFVDFVRILPYMKAQRQTLDRISALPQDTIEKILTLMPIRDALRTSILSRRWRYSWRTIPKLAFDDNEIVESDHNQSVHSDYCEIDNYKFVKAIFHVLLLHRAPILEFSLSSTEKNICSEIDQIILHLSSSNNVKKIVLKIWVTDGYQLPGSFYSLQGLEHIDLTYCTFEPPLMNTGFSMLKRLHFWRCPVTSKTLLGFLTKSPLLEQFTWTGHSGTYIELTESELVEMFKCLPSVQVFEISMLHIKHLVAGSMPHKLPISLPHLKILDLGVCYLELFSLLCVISSSPNLEKLKLEMCWRHDMWCPEQTLEKVHDVQDYTGLNLDHLEEVEITGSVVVMGRSPMLKRATIELCISVSVDKEVDMLRDLIRMPISRASPTANFIIKRPRNYRSKMLLGFLTNCPLLEEFTWSGDYGMDIELTESELLELFKCLPSVQVFEISMLHIKHLAAGSMPHKLSISLPHLRILDLHMCYLELSSVLCVIRISPKLEKMKLEMCWDHDQSLEQTFNNLHELQDYTSLNLDHFKEVEITRFRDPCGSWMEFVKVVMGRSPMLKRATIELCKSVSIDKEVEMYQDLMKAQRQTLDRISALPQDTIEKILTLMPIRDALRTSILSRRWRYSWRTIPKLAFDDSDDSDDDEINQDKFVKAIFHVLLLHRSPILEFSLYSTKKEINSEIDLMILHLSSSNNVKKIVLYIFIAEGFCLPYSFYSLQGLEHIDLSFCTFKPPLMNKGFSMLKSLQLYECSVTSKMLLEFLTNCPLLEEFTWSGGDERYIELTESELVDLLKCLPSVQVLKIPRLHIKHLVAGSTPHKLPTSLPHLRILDLGVCYLELSSLLCVISSSPNLEKLKLEMCWDHGWFCPEQTLEKLDDLKDYTGLNLDHFKELEITNFTECGSSWMEFVKVVMGRSPMLKRATIALSTSVSVDKEVEMYQDLIRFPFLRASPTASFIIKRPRNYRR